MNFYWEPLKIIVYFKKISIDKPNRYVVDGHYFEMYDTKHNYIGAVTSKNIYLYAKKLTDSGQFKSNEN